MNNRISNRDFVSVNDRIGAHNAYQSVTPTWVTAMMCATLLAEMYYCLLLITN
jgi:hypothetical protein